MSDPDVPSPDSADHARRFAQRIQAEVAADAERRRREDPRLARTEREIERAWAHVAPPGAVGPAEELLLDRIDRLSLVDVDAPLGSRAGVRQIKGAIRKGTYWYLRYMSDQLNALHNVQARLLRRFDERLTAVESAVGLDQLLVDLVSPAPSPGSAVGAAVATRTNADLGTVMVVSCGTGSCVGAIVAAGVPAFGVDDDPGRLLAGIDEGLDLRVADPALALAAIEPGSLGGVVIGGPLQRLTVAGIVEVVGAARAACTDGGIVAVAVETSRDRSVVDTELLAGRGVAPQTWAHVLQRSGASTETVAVDDTGIEAVVIARLP